MKQSIFLVFITFFFFANGLGQNLSENSKANIFFDKAYKYYLDGDIQNSLKYCSKAVKKDSLFTEPYVLKAQIYFENNKLDVAISLLNKVIHISPEYKQIYFIISKYLIAQKQFLQAIKYLKKYISLEKYSSNISEAKRLIAVCEFRMYSLKKPIEYKPFRLSDLINTTKSEYFPTISADNSVLIFTRLIGNGKTKQEDIFIFKVNENKVESISKLINTKNNEGAHTVSADGKTIIFTRCTPYSGCDLFISTIDNNGKWSKPIKLPAPINTRYWESQPSLSPDGKTLFFVSNRPGGKGKMDIWFSTINKNNRWSKARNLGDSINTKGNEMSPFLHFDNKTLYFSSDYHIGMGKFDIFKSTKINDSTWLFPKNLAYPLNTEEDEYRLVVNPSGETAYLSSAVDTNFKQDIFKINLFAPNKPERIIYLKVSVFDDINKKLISADNVLVVDLNDYDTVCYKKNISQFLSFLKTNTDFGLNIIKKNYLFFSENFSLQNISDSLKFYEIDVFLKPIIINEIFTLKNIFFETDSYLINQKSLPELNKFVEFLKINSSIDIQINGHTDNIGTYAYNITLSNNRALEIKKYLVENGINQQRIKHKGFGYLQPKADNGTKIGRKLNRRIEILILKK